MEYYLAIRRNNVTAMFKTWKNLENIYTKLKKPYSKNYIFCDSIYMAFYKK